MSGEDIYDLIERYFDGSFTAEEKATFENRLQSEPDLARKVEFYKLTNKLVIENRLREVKSVIREESAKVKGRNGNYGKIALSVIILATIGLAWYINFRGSDSVTETIDPLKNNNTTSYTPIADLPNDSTEVDKEDNISLPEKTISDKKVFPQQKEIEQEYIDTLVYKNLTPKIQAPAKSPDAISKSDPEPQQIVVQSKSDLCEGVRFNAQTSLKHPCKGDVNGEITITGIKGGKGPYLLTINGSEKSNTGIFSGMSANEYLVEITDAENCKGVLGKYTLAEVNCRKELHFNPFIGEELHLPVYEKKGVLTVYDKAGNLYFRQVIEANEKFSWNGNSRFGEVKAQYLIFVIEYEDGTNEHGSITIAQ